MKINNSQREIEAGLMLRARRAEAQAQDPERPEKLFSVYLHTRSVMQKFAIIFKLSDLSRDDLLHKIRHTEINPLLKASCTQGLKEIARRTNAGTQIAVKQCSLDTERKKR